MGEHRDNRDKCITIGEAIGIFIDKAFAPIQEELYLAEKYTSLLLEKEHQIHENTEKIKALEDENNALKNEVKSLEHEIDMWGKPSSH